MKQMKKYLIINADDFGYNQEQNKAITELLENGLITSTSVMAVAPEADECSKLDGASYSVGAHLTINSDNSDSLWKSITCAESLGGTDGLPYDSKKLTFGAKRKDVRAELDAQYNYLISKGVKIDHADNHCGTLYGINGRRFYIDAFDFCASNNLPFRFPKTVGFAERQIGRKIPKAVLKVFETIVRKGENRNVKMLDDLVSNPWGMDRIKSYKVLRDYYIDAVDNCIDGITEMFLHPALPIDEENGPWTKRVYEYELLKSGDLLQRAYEKNIEVVSWKIFQDNR